MFNNSILGFLLGSTVSGAGVYYYILEEYRVSNMLLNEDIYVRKTPKDPSITASTDERNTRHYKLQSSA